MVKCEKEKGKENRDNSDQFCVGGMQASLTCSSVHKEKNDFFGKFLLHSVAIWLSSFLFRRVMTSVTGRRRRGQRRNFFCPFFFHKLQFPDHNVFPLKSSVSIFRAPGP